MRTGAALGMGPEATESDAAETSCLAAALGMGSEATESDAVVVESVDAPRKAWALDATVRDAPALRCLACL